MRKGNAPFVFSVGVVVSMAVVACGGDDGNATPAAGGSANSSGGGGAGGSTTANGGGVGELDGGRGGRGGQQLSDGGGGIRFSFDVQPRDTGPSNCPSAMPMDNDPCTEAATCGYPGGGCTCQREGRDAGRSWHCAEFPMRDGGYVTCADGTETGVGCDVQGKFCTTGTQTCGCFGINAGDKKWTCF